MTMKLVYKGRFNGDVDSLPRGEHRPGAVPFREFSDPKKLALAASGAAIVITVCCLGIYYWRAGFSIGAYVGGCLLSLLSVIPHELLHGLCFRGNVYLYTNLKQGMMFVTGPEDMSKARFIAMSLLPNLVFGFLPFFIGVLLPRPMLAVFGAFCIGMGTGDYYNIANAVAQMPKGARTYLHGFASYWYMPNA